MTPATLRAALGRVPGDAPMTLGTGDPQTVLALDHAIFHRRADRVDRGRLEACMGHASAQFTVARVHGAHGVVPIGYTGWFTLTDGDRDALLAGRLDRQALRPGDGEAVYLFAWGMLRAWRGHGRAAELLRALGEATRDHAPRLALLVSPAGARVAKRFGLGPTGVRYGNEALWATRSVTAPSTA